MTDLVGVILSGGYSRRVGMPKHSLPFGDRSMLEHIEALLLEVVDHLFVVAATDQEIGERERVTVVRDIEPDCGPLEGIATGLEAAQPIAELAFVTSCDVPLLIPAYVRRLCELLDDHEIVAIDDGTFRHPLGAVYRTSVAMTARAQLKAGARSLQSLLDCCQTKFANPGDVREVDPELRSLRNLNTQEEYLAAANIAGIKIPQRP